MRSNTYIRAILHLDPDALTDNEWALQTQQAEWMSAHQASQIAKIISQIFSK